MNSYFRMCIFTPAVLFFLCLNIMSVYPQNIELVITGIRSGEGRIVIGIFRDNESFKKEIPFKQLKFDKTDISERSLTVNFEMESGFFGFTLLDDENNNGDMDYNILGIPKEGFGFSGYDHKGLIRPHFDLFKQEILKNKKHRIEIKIKYF